MDKDKCVNVSRDLYLLAADKLLTVCNQTSPETTYNAIQSMGPADFLSDLTVGQVTGVIRFLDWILIHDSYYRGKSAGKATAHLEVKPRGD